MILVDPKGIPNDLSEDPFSYGSFRAVVEPAVTAGFHFPGPDLVLHELGVQPVNGPKQDNGSGPSIFLEEEFDKNAFHKFRIPSINLGSLEQKPQGFNKGLNHD